jgi:flagellar hook assembly protein FlgD
MMFMRTPSIKIIFSTIVLSLLCGPIHADIAFYDPVNLSYTSGHSFAPTIDVSSSGEIYVAWHDNDPGNQDIFFIKSNDHGTSYEGKLNLSNNDGNSSFVDIKVSSNDYIYVAWADSTSGKSDIYMSYSTNGGSDFSSPLNMTNSDVNSSSSKVAVDSRERLYVTWIEDTSITLAAVNNFAIVNSVTSFENGASPGIAIDGDDYIHLTYLNNATGDDTKQVRYTHSRDGGRTFLTPVDISDGIKVTSSSVDVSRDGVVHVVWSASPTEEENSDIYYTVSTDQGLHFSDPINITNNEGLSVFPNVFVDDLGWVHVVWNDTTPGNYETMYAYSSDNGQNFSEPLNITPSELGSLKAQVAADVNGYIHVTSDDNRYDSVFEAVVATGREGIPTFSDINLSTQVLSPNGDQEDDQISITTSASETLLWVAEIIEENDTRPVYYKRSIGTNVSLNWDGRNMRGALVDDGSYEIKLSGRTQGGVNAVTKTAVFSVNTTPADEAPVVVSFSADNTISPNNDGRQEEAFFTFEFNKSVDWNFTIADSSGTTRYSTSGTGTLGDIVWEGVDNEGVILADGGYVVTLSGSDALAQTTQAEAEILVDTIAPEYSNLTITPDPFSPTEDGVATISVDITANSLVTVYILQSDGIGLIKELDRTFYYSDQTVTLTWDGTSDGGSMVSPDSYQVSIWIRDNASNRVSPYPIKTMIDVE